jgi:uncharacterized protein (DUF1330 family)
MSAYLVADVDWRGTDRDIIMQFSQAVTPIILQHGGKFLVDRGTAPEPVEGDWNPAFMNIVEFPTAEAARTMLASPEFQAAAGIRRQTRALFRQVLIQGLE